MLVVHGLGLGGTTWFDANRSLDNAARYDGFAFLTASTGGVAAQCASCK